ncbi:ATP-binding protein [Streptosporangium subroseum]|uniref:ATP-binding protein n=1 Tax=Streptosporangium subroseum TaxID=106412 RepID=UPI003091B54C|nr:winged helix-turn-helix domain-containing protein [Streptosporangium subroseum]
MRFGILGPVEARSTEGDLVPVGGPRLRALLALLLVDADRVVTVERMIDGLYGETPRSGAANALQSQVSRLRRGLPNRVEFHPAGYRLVVDREDVDAHRFERLAREGRRALAAGDHSRAAGLLREGLGLWRGAALADVSDAPFAEAQAARLEELRIAAFEDLADAGLALGEHRGIVAELQEMVAAHPVRERLRGQLMRALYGAGRQAEALLVFEDARRTLAEEVGADPSAELAEVHLAVLLATPSLAARPTPPAQFSSFVGRGEELARVGGLLGGTRLVTLTGAGGVGKTRLAIEAARRQAGEVCFVDLAPLGDGAEVAQVVIAALGLRESGPLPPVSGSPDSAARLVAGLAGRRMLLVLDNCEHLVGEVARLVRRLLGACPELRVLATSREALGITGESLCPLPPLALPALGAAPEEALGYPAVRLFADRVAAVRPGFEVNAGNVETVLRICAALDGLPLAVELAAARLRSLTVDEVATRLDDRFGLLSRGDRTAAARHRTLRAVIEWSWDLLDENERLLARRLTVFSGGVTLEAAARICGVPDAADLVTSLVDKSLVEADGGRYRMLDTVRAFCVERLTDTGEQEELRRAHAAYFLDLAETADPRLRGAEQLEWMTRLTAEHGNLHAALRWAVRADTELGLRLVAALSWYWWLSGLRDESAPLAAELIDALGARSTTSGSSPGPPPGLAEEYVLCVVNAAGGSPALERIQSSTIPPGRWLRRPQLLLLFSMAGGPRPAGLPIPPGLLGPDPWSQGLGRLDEGFRRLFSGEPARAEAAFRQALDSFRSIGDRWGIANSLDRLAELAGWRGDRGRSLALAEEALALLGQLGAAEDTADLLCRRAYGVMRAGGSLAAAYADYERAVELARTAGVPETAAGASETVAGAHRGLGEIARLRGDLAGARRLFELALEGGAIGPAGTGETRSRALVGLGRIAEAEGNTDEARYRHHQALTVALDHRNHPAAADAIEGAAGLALLEGDGERAALLLGVAVAVRGTSIAGDPDVARVATGSQGRIGAGRYAAAFERGAAMTLREALALLGTAPSGA